jgi:hypothetical protein
MPFVELDYSPALRDQVGLPERPESSTRPYSYSIFRHTHGHAFFYRRYESDGREWSSADSFLRLGNDTYKIVQETKGWYKDKRREHTVVQWIASFTAETDGPLTKSLRARIRRYLAELPLDSDDRKHRNFRVMTVDKSKPRQSRSIGKLIKFLNRYSAALDKPLLILCQPVFLSSLYDDEIQKVHKYICETNGKGLTPLAILFFELGVREKKNFSMDSLMENPRLRGAANATIAMFSMVANVEDKA